MEATLQEGPMAPVGAGHARESGRCLGSASTGTVAFAAMGRSYRKAWRVPTAGGASTGGYTRGTPLVGTPRGQAAAGRQAREAAIGRSYRKAWRAPTTGASCRGTDGSCRSGPCPRKRSMPGNASTGTGAFAGMARSYKSVARSNGRWRINRGIYKGPPLLVRHAAKPPRAARPERRPWAAPTRIRGTFQRRVGCGPCPLASATPPRTRIADCSAAHPRRGTCASGA